MKTQFLMGLSEKSSNYAYASQELCEKNIVILFFKVRISKKTNEICFCDVCKNFIRKKEVHEITTTQRKKGHHACFLQTIEEMQMENKKNSVLVSFTQ